jgi:hypothetical protein
MSWVLLITSLPTENATARMRAWRALKTCGAAVLRDGVYLIPETEDTRATLEKVEQDVSDSGGTAYLLDVTGQADYPFSTLFDRTADYSKLANDITDCIANLQSASLSDLNRQVRKLRNAYGALCSIDFFPGEAQRQLATQLTDLESRLAAALSPDEPTGKAGIVLPRTRADYIGRVWATRKDLWVDRVCSAWLIRRFIDIDARFLWLDSPSDCPSNALGFDFDGATFTHLETKSGQLVTFENLLASFGLNQDAALQRFAQLVHFLDVGGLPVPEAAGLERLLKGIRSRTRDDDSLLHAASQIFDDLYLAFQQEENQQ